MEAEEEEEIYARGVGRGDRGEGGGGTRMTKKSGVIDMDSVKQEMDGGNATQPARSTQSGSKHKAAPVPPRKKASHRER